MLHRYWKHLWDEMSDLGRRTLPWDLVRGAAHGGISSLYIMFGLLVAIKHFDAGTVQKSIIAGSFCIGLMLSLPYASRSPVLSRRSVRGALPTLGAAVGIVVAALAPNATVYTCGMLIYGICAALPLPILTAIYRENYSGTVRGQVVAITAVTTVAVGLATQFVGGKLLDVDMSHYRALYLVLAGLVVVMGLSILRMPDRRAEDSPVPNPLTSFSALRENPIFAYVLFAWFLFGFANLALQPQRIEYLSQPQYGLELSPGRIVLIVGVTTELARLCVIPIWGRLFDRFNFIWIRILLCIFILAYILIFYHTRSIPMLVVASACLGTAYGGGAIAWMLWVTKFASREDTARYMSVHTFLTGVRGAIGPLIGYVCVEHLTIQSTSWLAAGLVTLSMLMLWRVRNTATRA